MEYHPNLVVLLQDEDCYKPYLIQIIVIVVIVMKKLDFIYVMFFIVWGKLIGLIYVVSMVCASVFNKGPLTSNVSGIYAVVRWA